MQLCEQFQVFLIFILLVQPPCRKGVEDTDPGADSASAGPLWDPLPALEFFARRCETF